MSAQKSSLTPYQKRRDFSQTPEPAGKTVKKSKNSRFVIQKHDAQNLHYDLRLAIDGVLVSWAVPKGPSTDPRVKRLAIKTEDHPLEYATFEGVIPEGQYGAGPVMVWDTGSYQPLEKNGATTAMSTALKNGKIEVFLNGTKIYGAYALIRTKRSPKEWLLIKMKDEHADARRNPVSTQKKSVTTGRTMTQIQRDAQKGRS